MFWVDAFATYLYGLKIVALGVAVLILITSIDDLFIDIVYWVRRAWRAVTVYRTHDRLDYRALYGPAERPLAIMVPAWNETGVIGRMAELAATTLDYENYHVFVGTYPNDADTQRDVDEVCARFKNVHKVVCARPGPTSKADCLNNVLDAILQFEARANLTFAGFILHDAEDVISPLELRLFNYLVDRKDLIQVPVYPFARRWWDVTSAHYMDEFAELHGKDMLVREALAGQVPSAGVGTCFSRRAVTALLADGNGVAFDVQSLTEDYDIAFRLRAKGMTEIFVRFPVLKPGAGTTGPHARFGASADDATVIGVREYFPNTLAAAVRQKSRWIIGIVYQGFNTHGWTRDITLNYFLWRDRKGGIVNFVSFAASWLFLQLVGLWVYQLSVADSYQFLSVFEGSRALTLLLAANLVFMINRMAQRAFFVTRYYGLVEGVLSIPRLFWGNFVNFLANCRAIVQIVRHGNARRVAWDKTAHDFPSLGEPGRVRRPLGQILVAHGALDQAELDLALVNRTGGLRLGTWLVHQGVVSSTELARAIGEQAGVSWESVDAGTLAPRTISLLPAALALHYAVVPLREEGRTLILAAEDYLDPVSLAALERKLQRPVSYVIALKGQVTVGLREWYARRRGGTDPRQVLDGAVACGEVPASEVESLWERYVAKQLLFGEVLVSLGHLDAAALDTILLRHERSAVSLGQYLVDENIVGPATLQEALARQCQLQGSMDTVLDARRRRLAA